MAIKMIVPNDGNVDLSLKGQSGKLKRKITGATSAMQAMIYVYANTAPIVSTPIGTLLRQDITIKHIAHDHYEAEIPYGIRTSEEGEYSWDFDTTGATVHITHAREEVARFPANEAPNQHGTIGADGDQITGTEKVIPQAKMNITFNHPRGVVTTSMFKFLAQITGTTNSTPFMTFAAGEVLFLGARGSDGSNTKASVVYQFAMSQNSTSANPLTFGDIVNVVKKGHEVAWVKYQDATETVAGKSRPVRKPKFVYVNRIYDALDLRAALGFG